MTESTWSCDALTEAETDALGVRVGKALEPGSVVALVGELGAGKTRFVQGVMAGLGTERRLVRSPTFSLINEYHAAFPIYHFDTYRLRDVDEFLELGADEMFASDGVCLIEWADRVAETLPADVLWITIHITSSTARRFDFRATGERSQRILERVQSSRA